MRFAYSSTQRRKHQGLIARQLNSQKREGRSFIQHDAINACIEENEAVGRPLLYRDVKFEGYRCGVLDESSLSLSLTYARETRGSTASSCSRKEDEL